MTGASFRSRNEPCSRSGCCMFRLSGVHCGFLMHVPDTGTRHFPRSSWSPGRLAVVLYRMWVDGSEFQWSKDEAVKIGRPGAAVSLFISAAIMSLPPIGE